MDKVSDTEDIPSDFFDDFSKQEFMDGLSVIDSWGDDNTTTNKGESTGSKVFDVKTYKSKYKMVRRTFVEQNRELEDAKSLNIEQGPRRDRNKTKQAIMKDKNLKVKQILAKAMESQDDIRPPGTELDEFYGKNSSKISHKQFNNHYYYDESEQEEQFRGSPGRHVSPHSYYNRKNNLQRHSPIRRSNTHRYTPSRQSPRKFIHRKNNPTRHSPGGHDLRRHSPGEHNPPRYSPEGHSLRRHSQQRFSLQRRSTHRFSPRKSPHMVSPEEHGSWRCPQRDRSQHRSPRRHYSPHQRYNREDLQYHQHKYENRQLHSPFLPHQKSKSPQKDSFLYPEVSHQHSPSVQTDNTYSSVLPAPTEPMWETNPKNTSYVQPNNPNYMYPVTAPSEPIYAPTYPAPYNYGVPIGSQAPITPYISQLGPVPVPVPAPVPPPNTAALSLVSENAVTTMELSSNLTTKEPFDALSKLLADGSISKEDYMKLAPNKGVMVSSTGMDVKEKVQLLTRCHEAMSSLKKLHLPNRLVMLNQSSDVEKKSLMPKFCSPLKRQSIVEFQFTNANGAAVSQQNKKLVNSILAAVGLEKIIAKPKKKSKNTMDAGVQTTTPFCQVCEIRESFKYNDAATSIQSDHFCTSVETQVIEKDLLSSKTVFTHGGGVDNASISISHMTPAQLVSQLAARAKTFKPNNEQMRGDYSHRTLGSYQNYGNPYPSNYNYRY